MMTLNATPSILNITFNCVWEGLTPVTVVLPLKDGAFMQFTFTKSCELFKLESEERVPHCAQFPSYNSGLLGQITLGVWSLFQSEATLKKTEIMKDNAKNLCEGCEDGYTLSCYGEVCSAANDADESDDSSSKEGGSSGVSSEGGDKDWSDPDEDWEDTSESTSEEPSVGDTCTVKDQNRWDEDWGEGSGDDDDWGGGGKKSTSDEDEDNWDEDEWDDWDESRWKDSEDRRGMEESAGMDATSKDHNAGFVDVSSTPRMTKNVVSSGQPRVEYSIPALGENVPYEVIPSDTKKSRFYLSVPSGSQQFGALTVKEMALEGAETGVPPTKTSLVGKITSGGSVAEGEANLFFDVEYNCQHAGVSAVLVVIPMEPSEYGSISFRLVKVCGGYKRTYNTAYSMSELLPRLMVLIGLCVISVFGFRFVSRKISEGKTRSRGGAYSQVSQQGARGVI